VKSFGTQILRPHSRTIDRRALGRIVFASGAQRRALNAIMHPQIINVIRQRLARIKNGIVVIDAPLLIETGLLSCVDKLVVVVSSQNHQIKRAQARQCLSREEALSRIRSQAPLQDKVRMADFVIDNNGSLRDLRKKVTQLRRMWWTN